MFRRIAITLLVSAMALCLVFASGCTIAKIGGRGAAPLMLNNPPAKVQVIEHFKVSKMRVFDYTGSYDVSEIIADKLTESKADAVINLNIVLKTTVGDFFVNLITLGIASARTIMVEGDLVKAPSGLGSILDGKTILADAANQGDLTAALENLSMSGTAISGIFHQDGRFILVQ